MVMYRRYKIPGATYFFTVTLRDRTSSLLTTHINLLRESMRQANSSMPYKTIAIVILPDHIHTIWELPKNDFNYAARWRKIKTHFTQSLRKLNIPIHKNARGEYDVWQKRYWEHVIRNDQDLENHINYIHYNPIKHGLVEKTRDWKYSSFHRYVQQRILPLKWSDNAAGPDLTVGE